jgi:DNA-binding NarL/FixJ family response regulator
VIVYGNDDGALFFEAVDAGAVGFVSDRAGARDFERAATALRNGAPSVFPEHTRRRMSSRGWPAADNGLVELERLTRREREVLEGLVAGLSPAAIAERDFVSVITVRNQVQAILTKLNVHSQLEAVATVHRYGWMLHTA